MSLGHAQPPTALSTDLPKMSIVEGLRRASPKTGLTVLDGDLRPYRLSYHELADRAEHAARTLHGHGVEPGDRVCLLAPTSPELLIVLFGVWRLGAVPVMMPRPQRPTAGALVAEVARRSSAAMPALLVTTEQDADLLTERVHVPAVGLTELSRSTAGTGRALPPMPSPDSIGVLQFTSGTTAVSRAVPVTQAQLISNIAAVQVHADLCPGTDVYVSWLPLYHDMGIVSLAGIAAAGLDLVTMATETFMRQPACWLRAVSDHGGTFTAAPNFAYTLAAKVQALRPAKLDLTRLRVAINGSEAIDAAAMASAQQVLGDCGLAPTAMCPMYGLAEATLAVSGSRPDEAVRVTGPPDSDPDLTADPVPRPARPLVSCGPPLPGCEVRIRHPDGGYLADGLVGEVMVRGPGVVPGYWTADGRVDSTDTHRDGWLATGDLGFLDGGEVVICGRIKDMIIAGGRNLYPEDYETVAEQIPAVRSGGVVAFSLTDQERMVVVVEGRGRADLETLGRQVMDALKAETEHAPHEVLLVRPGTLPKTSSGKRQRRLARARYQDNTLDVLHAVR